MSTPKSYTNEQASATEKKPPRRTDEQTDGTDYLRNQMQTRRAVQGPVRNRDRKREAGAVGVQSTEYGHGLRTARALVRPGGRGEM